MLINDPHLYDYGVPFDNGIKKKYSLEDAINIIKEALSPLGEKYLKIIDYLIDNHHIDALLDKNKHQSITFSWSSYCFMNYREAYADLKNLIHEIGHIVNAYLSEKHQPYIYSDSTVFVGETASLVNEILLNRYLLEHAESEEEKLFYLSSNIENYFVKTFKQTMYTEFENKLYGYVQNKNELTADLLWREYSILQKKYFGEFTIYDECSSIEWSRLGHLYRWSYYVYKYATGLIMASSVANSIINKKEGFLDKYFKFLSAGSNAYSLDLLKEIDIDLTNQANMDSSFELLQSDILEFNKILLKNKK